MSVTTINGTPITDPTLQATYGPQATAAKIASNPQLTQLVATWNATGQMPANAKAIWQAAGLPWNSVADSPAFTNGAWAPQSDGTWKQINAPALSTGLTDVAIGGAAAGGGAIAAGGGAAGAGGLAGKLPASYFGDSVTGSAPVSHSLFAGLLPSLLTTGANIFGIISQGNAQQKAADAQTAANAAQLEFLKQKDAEDRAQFAQTQALNLSQYNARQGRLAPYRNIGDLATGTLTSALR